MSGEENKALVRRYFEDIANRANLAVASEIITPISMLQPTGKRFQHEGIRIFQIADGKLAETWGGADTLSQLQQLGFFSIAI